MSKPVTSQGMVSTTSTHGSLQDQTRKLQITEQGRKILTVITKKSELASTPIPPSTSRMSISSDTSETPVSSAALDQTPTSSIASSPSRSPTSAPALNNNPSVTPTTKSNTPSDDELADDELSDEELVGSPKASDQSSRQPYPWTGDEGADYMRTITPREGYRLEKNKWVKAAGPSVTVVTREGSFDKVLCSKAALVYYQYAHDTNGIKNPPLINPTFLRIKRQGNTKEATLKTQGGTIPNKSSVREMNERRRTGVPYSSKPDERVLQRSLSARQYTQLQRDQQQEGSRLIAAHAKSVREAHEKKKYGQSSAATDESTSR